MPAIAGTVALLSAINSETDHGIERLGSKLTGGEDRRAARDAASELKGAQADAIKQARDKAAADQANAENKAFGDALRKRARQGATPTFGDTLLTQPLGADSAPPASARKTLLGA